MTLKRSLTVLVFFMVSLVVPSWAQSDRATITGTLKDASSAVVAGVHVKALNTGTNVAQETNSDPLGYYRLNNLPVGTYNLTFSKNGFKSIERKGIVLLISQVAEINGTLEVGGASETVEVTTEAPILQTENAAVGTNLNSEAVSELPLNVSGSRNLSNFMFAYVPGVEGSDYSSHINGGMAMTKEVLIDGTSAVSQLGGYISESQPPMEAVQEFEADTAGISADAGRSGGGVFRYEMKSGANAHHGSLFGFMHSTSLNALSASNHLSAITDPANASAYLHKSDSLSDWGGSFGGAIRKDKLFYFVAFERYMQSNWAVGANTRTVPTDSMMGLDSDGNPLTYADMSPVLTPTSVLTIDSCGNNVFKGAIYDPTTGCVFPSNQIPVNRISKVSAKVLQLFHTYYKPQSSLTTNDAGPAYSPDPWFHNTQSSIKVDYNRSATQHINGSFYWDDYPRINADQGGVWSVNSQYGGPMANSYWHKTTAPGARLSYEVTLTPNLVNTAYATFNRFSNPSIATSQSAKWDSTLGIYDGAGNFPLVYFESGEYTNGANYQNGWSFSNLGSQFNDHYAGNTFLYSDQLNWSHKKHYIKAGLEFRAMQFNYQTDLGTFMGGYPLIFDPSTTAGYGWQQTGNAFGSFLLGDVYNAETNNPDPEYGRRKAVSVYASDDIKVNQRLTVNLSLRWDFNGRYHEKFGHWSSFVLEDYNYTSGMMGQYEYLHSGADSFERRQDYYNYAPHLGLSYKINDKTVARANLGVFFVPINMNTWGGLPYQQAGNFGFHDISQQHGFNWDDGYTPTTTRTQSPVYTTSDVVSIDPRGLIPGNTQQYSVGVQRDLGSQTKLDAEWVQSRSYHLHSGTLRTDQPTVANLQNYLWNGKFPDSYVENPYFGYGGDYWQGITPYPQVYTNYGGPLLSVGSPLGNSDYKGMQLSITRRVARGLSTQASYVWSRTHGDVDSDFQEPWGTGSLQNIYDLKHEAKNIADFDVTHVVKGYIIYYLPFGRGRQLLSAVSPLVDNIIGGWSLNGDFHYNTGTPISIHSTNSYPGFNSVYVNLKSGCKLTNGSPKLYKQWLNTECFENPASGYLGTAGNYIEKLRYPGTSTEDLGLHKSLVAGSQKQYSLTLRLEFFNVFNRHNLGGPDTNMGDSTFGEIVSYGGVGGRVGQFGARLNF